MSSSFAAAAEAAPFASDLYCYSVYADAHPGALPRVLEPFAKLGLVPHRCHAMLEGRRGERLVIDLQVGGLEVTMADHIAAALRALPCVETVLTARA